MANRVLVIVPARHWSAGRPGKNRPLMPGAGLVYDGCDVVLATDDPLLAITAPCPVFWRAPGDDGPVGDLVRRVLIAFPSYDVIVVAAPASPTQHRARYIRAAIDLLEREPTASSVVSVVPWQGEPPAKACYRAADGSLFIPADAPDRRQDCAQAYRRDGTCYVVRAQFARDGDLYGPRPLPMLVTPSDSVTLD